MISEMATAVEDDGVRAGEEEKKVLILGQGLDNLKKQ